MLDWNQVLAFASNENPCPDKRISKPEHEWQQHLSPEIFYVTRRHGTEPPFSSSMCGRFEPGQYHCVCCDSLLFDAGQKYDSGSGWPSFTQPARLNAIAYHRDSSHGMQRIETRCNCCDAHLGHVFPDGPPPTGLRYCINALALVRKQ